MSSISDPIEHSARTAARRLAAEHGPELLAEVEAALHARRTSFTRGDQHSVDPISQHSVDPISLAGLIISVATLAWTIYNDLRTKTAEPSPVVVSKTIRVQLDDSLEASLGFTSAEFNDAFGLNSTQLDNIIATVAAETVQATSKSK